MALDFDLAYDARGNAKTEHSKSKVALGDLENALKLYQAAIEDRDKAIELDPARALSYNNRGSTKFLRAVIRDYNGMIEDYQSAIFTEAIKRKSETYNLRGMRGASLVTLKRITDNQKKHGSNTMHLIRKH